MKSRYVIIASALFLSVASFAQKNEIKAAEKAIKSGKADEAITILAGVEYTIVNAADADKAQYYFVKGNAYLDLANKKAKLPIKNDIVSIFFYFCNIIDLSILLKMHYFS